MAKTSTISADYSYVPVTFREKNNNEQNSRKKVVYDVPIGTKIKLTSASYEIRTDGIYKKGESDKSYTKIREIDLPTFDMAALNAINAERTDVGSSNHQRIDDKDLTTLKGKKRPEITLANTLNNQLVKTSDFRVLNYENESGYVSGIECNAQNVSINFAPKDDLWHPTKSFALILPKRANG